MTISADVEKYNTVGNADDIYTEPFVAILIREYGSGNRCSVRVTGGGATIGPSNPGPLLFEITPEELCLLGGSFIINFVSEV